MLVLAFDNRNHNTLSCAELTPRPSTSDPIIENVNKYIVNVNISTQIHSVRIL